MNVLDIFSGIGGFSLGLERAGMRTVAFCEIDPYCRAVLRKHWPDVPIFEDVRELTAADVSGVDVICGGFPCQDISVAGKGAGLAGERSGLWRECTRLVGETRPRYVIVENSAALLGRGLGTVLGDLAALGYSAEWHCIQAADVGAKHIRDRVWVVGMADASRVGIIEHWWQQFKANSDTQWQIFNGFDQPEPARVAYGISHRMDRLRAIGNAVVPQIPEIIGRAIVSAESNARPTHRPAAGYLGGVGRDCARVHGWRPGMADRTAGHPGNRRRAISG